MTRFIYLVGLMTFLVGCVSIVARNPNSVSIATNLGESSYCYGLAMVGMDA